MDAEQQPAQLRDRGSVLPLVLVMMVIASLWVLPVMSYAMSVTKANTVLSDKTKRLEAVKSGLRVALADPVSLYERCGAAGTTVSVSLAPTEASGLPVSTVCNLIGQEAAQAVDERRIGVAATQAGKQPPAELTGTQFVAADPTSTAEWLTQTSAASETDKIWLPNLPVHALNLRSPDGYQMPEGYPACSVYFPGTYRDPITLDGPAYFASGIYYFESEVRVVGGASVVVGAGARLGCSTDQEAAFYAVDAPSTHNISGLGGTWVFGDKGRLVVTNEAGGPIDLAFNARYVAPQDTGSAPSADVSIISVNGDLDIDEATGIDLYAEGIIEAPLSQVGADETMAATQQDYLPSVYTPKPTEPDPVEDIGASTFDGAALVSWSPPPFDGGSPITGYTVTASTSGGCTTTGATECVVTGLSNDNWVDFTIVATNDVGDSDPSEPSSSVRPRSWYDDLDEPDAPSRPTATPYNGAARVAWTAPDDNGAPITAYTVTSSDGQTCVLETTGAETPPLQCDFTGLSALNPLGYTFTVVATNAEGDSDPSEPNLVPAVIVLGLVDLPDPDEPPAPPDFLPTPILEVDLPNTSSATISVPGYVSIPQGRIRVNNPNGSHVTMAGGVLAAQFDVHDTRVSVPIGFILTDVQRKLVITSSTSAGIERSVAVVQVNQNGAYAVNSWEVQ